MPKSATHTDASSQNRALVGKPEKDSGGKGVRKESASDAVDRVLSTPVSNHAPDLRAEVDLLRRMLGEQQRALRKSTLAAAQLEQEAAAAIAEAGRLREAARKVERDLVAEKASRAGEVRGKGEEVATLAEALRLAQVADADARKARTRERTVYAALAVGSAFASVVFTLLMWLRWHHRPVGAQVHPTRSNLSAGRAAVLNPDLPASSVTLGRVRQALSVLPRDTVRRILKTPAGPGCSVEPGSSDVALHIKRQGAPEGVLASALAKCAERLEAPLK